MGNVLSLAVSIGVPLGIGTTIGLSIKDEINGWYKNVKKPSWNPPNWIFGPVWTILYTAMGVASWQVWKAGGGPVPLGLYATQLLLNFAWTPIFFKQHNLGAAAADITALLGVLVATTVKFNEVSPTAAKLLIPYIGWTSFATALTYNIYLNNKTDKEVKKAE